MKSIYASKLYKASKRKEKIQAALLAPGNAELVMQLAEDLDEKYQTSNNLGIKEEKKEDEPKEAKDNDFGDFVVDEDINPKTDLMTMDDLKSPKPSGGHTSSPSNKESSSEERNESRLDEPSSKGEPDLMPQSPGNEIPSKSEDKPAEASTNVPEAEQIRATTLSDLTILKNTFNSRQDLAGVSRMAIKEGELWIYYNDSINLNNIMADVIEYLMASGYEEFEFNRLARSDNAMVFLVDLRTADNPKSIEDAEEK